MRHEPDSDGNLEPLLATQSSSPYLYRRQFVAAFDTLPAPADWLHHVFAGGLQIYAHSELASAAASTASSELLFLGDVFDPDAPAAEGVQIARRLAGSVTSLGELETGLERLSGRYLLFARIGEEARVYPDAAGLQSLYYVDAPSRQRLLGSQPRLLSEFQALHWNHGIAALRNPGFFPFAVLPYDDVSPLLPNHYLDLDAWQSERFWPASPLVPLGLEAAAAEMGDLLHGTVQAMAKRGECFLALSGGRDSRMLLAAFLAGGAAPQTGSFLKPGGEHFDVTIPRKLSQRIGFPYKRQKISNPSSALLEIYRVNTGGLFWDPSAILIESQLRELSQFDYGVTGAVAEVFRNFYHATDRGAAEVSAEHVSALLRFGPHPKVLASIEVWLADVGRFSATIDVWDLLYWEQRLGNWCSLSLTGRDTVMRQISPFNNRRLLELGLRAPAEARLPPYPLITKICEHLYPDVLAEPFNTSWYDSAKQYLWPRLPYKIRRAWEIAGWGVRGLSPARRLWERSNS